MACLLCYGTNDDLIDLISDEAKQYDIAAVLFKYLSFCFNVSLPNDFNGTNWNILADIDINQSFALYTLFFCILL